MHFSKQFLFEHFPSSQKIYVEGDIYPNIRVGMREILLSNKKDSLRVYDTSGPYGDLMSDIDFDSGIEKLRSHWVRKRKEHNKKTQMYYAKQGIITEEMEYVAIRENLGRKKLANNKSKSQEKNTKIPELITSEFVREELASGRAVIPANVNHLELEPTIIGKNFLVKVNANIGNSILTSSLDEELEKIVLALLYGTDTIMDLSTGKNIHQIRESIIRNSPVPIGTVPLYQALEKVDGIIEKLSFEVFKETLIEQAEQGVDYFAIHPGILLPLIRLANYRTAGIASKSGRILAKWCLSKGKENFLYTNFREICEIASNYDITLSLSDGLRPGSIADANDDAQLAELKVLGELVDIAREYDCQVMVEGPGHMPLNLIKENVEKEIKLCGNAPLFTLGPITTDIAPGYDHITSCIGAAMTGCYGASLLCYVTPREYLGIPNKEDIKAGIIAYKIAAHAANIAKGFSAVQARDDALSRARFNFNWYDQFNLSLDPKTARKMHDETLPVQENNIAKFCSIYESKLPDRKLSGGSKNTNKLRVL